MQLMIFKQLTEYKFKYIYGYFETKELKEYIF